MLCMKEGLSRKLKYYKIKTRFLSISTEQTVLIYEWNPWRQPLSCWFLPTCNNRITEAHFTSPPTAWHKSPLGGCHNYITCFPCSVLFPASSFSIQLQEWCSHTDVVTSSDHWLQGLPRTSMIKRQLSSGLWSPGCLPGFLTVVPLIHLGGSSGKLLSLPPSPSSCLLPTEILGKRQDPVQLYPVL